MDREREQTMSAADAGSAPGLTMTDAMDLVRYAQGLEGTAAHEGQADSHAHTVAIRNLARRIQNEATTGVRGAYTAADVMLVSEAAAVLGATADRIAAALSARLPASAP
jgi:hypothetical protein